MDIVLHLKKYFESILNITLIWKNITILVNIMNFRDTAGQERFRTITTAYYRGAMGIMLVYDVTNEKSFENIKNWIRNIEENASADVEKMLLGNKCELTSKRQVSKERGEALAIEYGIKFMETSAKSSINVEEAFFTLARDIKAKMEKRLVSNTFVHFNNSKIIHSSHCWNIHFSQIQ